MCDGKRDCPLQNEEEDCDCMKLYSFIVTCVSSGPFSSEKMNVKFLDENLYYCQITKGSANIEYHRGNRIIHKKI